MRQKRAKTYKRVMALYTQTFGFRQPFQVLVSQDLLLEGEKSDLNMHKQFLQVTQGECKPMITQCCMEALYKLGKDAQRTTNLAKTFERRKCNHRTPLEPDECLRDVIGGTNKHRYVLASQSSALRVAMQAIPGLPIIHFNPRGVLVLSPPSISTVREKNKLEEARRVDGVKELDGVVDGENVLGAPSVPAGAGLMPGAASGRKKKGINPLSVKKKKSVTIQPPATAQAGQKRRNDDEAPRERDGSAGAEIEGEGEGEGEGGSKKKRKRRKKSAVKDAIAELDAEAKADAEAAVEDRAARRAAEQSASGGDDDE